MHFTIWHKCVSKHLALPQIKQDKVMCFIASRRCKTTWCYLQQVCVWKLLRKISKEKDEHQARSGVMSCLHISRLKELLLLLSILSLHHTPEISLTSLSAAVLSSVTLIHTWPKLLWSPVWPWQAVWLLKGWCKSTLGEGTPQHN